MTNPIFFEHNKLSCQPELQGGEGTRSSKCVPLNCVDPLAEQKPYIS